MKLPIVTNQPLTMTTREVAALLNRKHSNIKISAERLASSGTLSLQGSKFTHNGNTYEEYLLSKRDCLILVAQNCPEFTAAIVDRWQELEEKQAKPAQSSQLPDLTDFIASLESNKVKIENQISEANKAQYHRDQFIAITSNLDSVTSKSQIQQECDCILNYLSSRGGSIDATSLENNILRTKNHPFSIYVNRGEARETLRSVVSRLSDSGYLKLDGDTVIKVTH